MKPVMRLWYGSLQTPSPLTGNEVAVETLELTHDGLTVKAVSDK
jgi:hypothetical protein